MIAELIGTLVSDLAPAEVPVYQAWPNRPDVPCLIVVPGQPYIAGGQTFGSYDVRVEVLILVGHADYPIALEDLNSLIETVLANTVDWALINVEQPSLVNVGASSILGAVVSLAKGARL